VGKIRRRVAPKASSDMTFKSCASHFFTRGLMKFRNIHKGETCYIFGDGPSVKWFDFSEFVDHPSICCGMIPFHRDFELLNAKYYVLVEPWLFVPRIFQPKFLHVLSLLVPEYRKRIEAMRDQEIFVSLSNALSLSGPNINYVYGGLPGPSSNTDRLLNTFNCFNGSFEATLAIAYYLGFKKVYLVGFDAWTIQPSRTLRWYELGEGEIYNSNNFAFEYLDVLKREMDIYTISKDGESCNVKNISYQSYTGNKPVFKENYELLSKDILNVLASATETGYKIFQNEN